ncbi:MAG: TetR/AcrR family transcriptional regulator [Pseudomonadota bacterium]
MSKHDTSVPENKTRTRGRPPSIDRNAALDAAVRSFWEHGYEGASLTTLTDAMGLSRPSLYAAFGDKAELFMRAMDRYGQTIGARPLQAFQSTKSISEAVRTFLTTALDGNTLEDAPSGCLFACCATTAAERDPAVRDQLADVFSRTINEFRKRFEAEAAAGNLSEDPTPQRRAELLHDLMVAQAVRARAGASRDELLAGLDSRAAAVLTTEKK